METIGVILFSIVLLLLVIPVLIILLFFLIEIGIEVRIILNDKKEEVINSMNKINLDTSVLLKRQIFDMIKSSSRLMERLKLSIKSILF